MSNKIIHIILLTCAVISGFLVVIAPVVLDSNEALALVVSGSVIMFASFIIAFWGVE